MASRKPYSEEEGRAAKSEYAAAGVAAIEFGIPTMD
jgi:hypothetical protein